MILATRQRRTMSQVGLDSIELDRNGTRQGRGACGPEPEQIYILPTPAYPQCPRAHLLPDELDLCPKFLRIPIGGITFVIVAIFEQAGKALILARNGKIDFVAVVDAKSLRFVSVICGNESQRIEGTDAFKQRRKRRIPVIDAVRRCRQELVYPSLKLVQRRERGREPRRAVTGENFIAE